MRQCKGFSPSPDISEAESEWVWASGEPADEVQYQGSFDHQWLHDMSWSQSGRYPVDKKVNRIISITSFSQFNDTYIIVSAVILELVDFIH